MTQTKMDMIEPEVFVMQHASLYKPLSDNDTLVFDKYKSSIDQKIRKTFPSILASFELKPVRVCCTLGCGSFYHYKVALPDNKFAKVSFHTGRMSIPSPDGTTYEPPEPTFTIHETLTSTSDE